MPDCPDGGIGVDALPTIVIPTDAIPESLRGRVRVRTCKVCGGPFKYTGSTIAEDVHEFTCLGCGRRNMVVQPQTARLYTNAKEPT